MGSHNPFLLPSSHTAIEPVVVEGGVTVEREGSYWGYMGGSGKGANGMAWYWGGGEKGMLVRVRVSS